ncbi:protein far1-related sequence 5-like [Gigaspora margarita]|uniref:Protein far1-related sequence 5-like n=1 Tax=Gigaspora margarita TaxID=4874 RepID=A0A8H4EQM7_GIGMA|nr:protein far1-related sequence 5-like [Gigaspora margarita]
MAIELSTDTIVKVNLNLQSLRNFQGSNYQASVQQITPQKNKFGVAFSIAKIAINIALKTKSDDKLVQLLKNFISTKQNSSANNNSNRIKNSKVQDENGIITLNQHLINQTSNLHVTKI